MPELMALMAFAVHVPTPPQKVCKFKENLVLPVNRGRSYMVLHGKVGVANRGMSEGPC